MIVRSPSRKSCSTRDGARSRIRRRAMIEKPRNRPLEEWDGILADKALVSWAGDNGKN